MLSDGLHRIHSDSSMARSFSFYHSSIRKWRRNTMALRISATVNRQGFSDALGLSNSICYFK
jgi:hypothetical protein